MAGRSRTPSWRGAAGHQRELHDGCLGPNDIDCVLLAADDFPHDVAALNELEDGLPFLDAQLVDRVAFDHMTERFFATDRDELPKGMVEVLL